MHIAVRAGSDTLADWYSCPGILNVRVEPVSTQHINEYTEGDERPESLWKRALIMIGFMIALGIGQTLAHLIAVLQFVALALNKRPSNSLGLFGGSLAQWMQDVVAYQCMTTKQKPFPWQPWPDATEIAVDDEAA